MTDEWPARRKKIQFSDHTLEFSIPAGVSDAAAFGDVAAALERAEKAERALAWRPIEAAPRDGTKVLLFWPQRPPADVGWWALDDQPPHRAMAEGFKAHGDRCIPPDQPTHWMPLPAPPLALTPEPTT